MAYTKYSLTPANNNATPPDGAPEGMLPSAVNDTMRDMMAQIRDVGDGIRNGTYTMTAPVITGGSITGVALSGNTFTNPVITGGSINNTPIGATTANTGAFTTLSASGVATFSAGTVSAPAITTTGDTNTGIFFPAADTIAFTEGGVESMRIDSSGNVGIGTSSPSYLLDVVGNVNGSVTSAVQNSNSGTSGFARFIAIANGGNAQFGMTSTGYTAITGAQDAMLFNSGGASGGIVFAQEGVAQVKIDSSGNVGIGTSSPVRNLQIGTFGTGNNEIAIASATNGLGSILFGDGGTGSDVYRGYLQYEHTNDALLFGTATSERMRITSGGSLLVRTTAGSGNLVLNNTDGQNFGYGFNIQKNGNGNPNYELVVGGDDKLYLGYSATTTPAAIGNFATNGTYTATSDIRKKKDISYTFNGLDIVSQLKPVQGRMLDDKESSPLRPMFIAQDMVDVLPSVVSSIEPSPSTDNPLLGIDYSSIIPVLTKAIQEQQAMIEELKQEVAALKAK